MPLRPAALLLCALMLALAPVAHAALEFAGYTTSREGVRFIVTDLDTKKTSDWLRVGDAFQEHTITGFDARTETLTVEHGGTTLRLPLKGAGTTTAAPAAAPTPEKPRQLNFTITPEGGILLDGFSLSGSSPGFPLRGPPLADDELRALFQQIAKTEAPFILSIHPPTSANVFPVGMTRKILDALQASGATKVTVRLVNAPPPPRADAPPAVVPKPAP